MNDIRYGFRQIFRSKSLSLLGVITLAMGIGACVSIYTVVEQVLLDPLPYPESDKIMRYREANFPKLPSFSVAPGNFYTYQERATTLEAMTAYSGGNFNLLPQGGFPERINGLQVTGDYFKTMGVEPALGRGFTLEEDQPGAEGTVVLSHQFWQEHFNGNPDVLNETILLNGERFSIVGVMPEGYDHPSPNFKFYTPQRFDEETRAVRGGHWLSMIGRLKDGTTFEQSLAELKGIAAQMEIETPESNKGWTVIGGSYKEDLVDDIRPALLTLLAAVGLLLIIACANVSNLMLTRASSRSREMSIRAALGASRGRIIRQLLVESIILALIGGAAGVALAFWGVDALLKIAPNALPAISRDVEIDLTVLLMAVSLSAGTGILFGIFPALQASRIDLNEALKAGGRGTIEGGSGLSLRNGLVVLEMGLSLTLMVGAGLLLRSFQATLGQDPGFMAEGAAYVRINLPEGDYGEDEDILNFFRELVPRVEAIPGVKTVGHSQSIPMAGDWVNPIWNPSEPIPENYNDMHSGNMFFPSPGYLEAMGIPLLEGEFFSTAHTPDGERVALVNQKVAEDLYPEGALGKPIHLFSGDEMVDHRIIGVVANVKSYGLRSDVPYQVYQPFTQKAMRFQGLIVRVEDGLDPLSVSQPLRQAVAQVDSGLALSNPNLLTNLIERSVAQEKVTLTLATVFAIIAFFLAVIGVYGVMTYTVNRRTNEIGIRMALGANFRNIVILILRFGLTLSAVGIALGLVGSLCSGFLMKSLLFQIDPYDPLVFSVTTLMLVAVCALACLIPSLRATSIDPMRSLREE